MSNLPPALAIGKTIGQILLSVLVSLMTGRTFRTLLLYPFQRLARRTNSQLEKQLVHEAEKDLGVDPLPPDSVQSTINNQPSKPN